MSYRDPDGYVSIEGCEATREAASGKALLIRVPTLDKRKDPRQSVWIPKFAIHDDSEVWSTKPDQNAGRLVLREDIATEKGLT